ncbi:ADP-ribosylglycohydrolase family protein [Streptomyces graminilatus]|uniref:ADP-ribosylglycohydrolase family protein n=1 Tax=Streptomyces graminilatus TaxID=1464070 RepID=UPI0006E26A97|nr:ADP-ribosylglycohydrolase family protein [Streptomyces graminilatus]
MTAAGTATGQADRVLGGWLGRIAGNMLGKPVERGDYWTRDRIDRYLRRTGALPLTDYLPEPPAGSADGSDDFELRPEWRQCVRGRIHGSCRDDDVDYAILGLDLLETHGFDFSTEQVGELWLLRLPFLQTFTAERAAYRNLAAGLRPPLTATYDNPYQEWIGALIRADIYGWTCPGDPAAAAEQAYRDATLTHTANGVYAAMFTAATIARAATGTHDIHACLRTGLTVVPPRSRLAAAIHHGIQLAQSHPDFDTVVDELHATHATTYHWVHAIPNTALIAAALTHADGDFTGSICRAVSGGWDTDSNGATAGSIAALLAGSPAALPGRWTDPLKNRLATSVADFNGTGFDTLAQLTHSLTHLEPVHP